MSKKTSPQSRPGRRPRKIRSGGTSAGSAAGVAPRQRAAQDQPAPAGLAGRLRRYLPAVAVPNLVVVLAIIAVALIGLLVTRTTLAALPATIAQLWLGINLVPVAADGIIIGVLPLLPTIGLIALIARRVHVSVRDRVSMADLAVVAAGTLLIPLVLTLIAAGMMWDAGRVFDVAAPPMGHAVARTLLVHAIALAIGMGGRLWRALLRRYGAPGWLIDAAATAARILLLLAGAALILLLILLVFGWHRQVEVASLYNSGAGVAAVVVLSLLYLPNAVIAALAVMLGSEFHIGSASISLYAIDLTALPPMPLFALVPGWAHPWSILLLVVTSLAVSYVLGSVRFTVVQTLTTAAFVAVIVLVASYLTSGQIGYLGMSGPMAWLTAGLAFAWTAGIGVAAALVGKLADRRAPQPEPEPEPEPVPVEAPAEDVDPNADEEILEGEVVEADSQLEVAEEPTAAVERQSVDEDAPEEGEAAGEPEVTAVTDVTNAPESGDDVENAEDHDPKV